MTQTMVEQAQETTVSSTAEHLERLATFPDQLDTILREQPREALTFRPSAESWSISEILGYLIVFGANWGNRVQQILSADAVHFVPMDADAAIQRFGFQHQQGSNLLAGFATTRADRVAFLRGLDAEHLARSGTHPDRGRMSVTDVIAVVSENDEQRYRQIVSNLRAYYKQQSGAHTGS